MSTSEQIRINMKNQGRTYSWLINQLKISRRTFYNRLNENTWQIGDLMRMKDLGIL